MSKKDIGNGTILLVNTIKSKRSFLTKGIQLAEGSIWNHAAILVMTENGLQVFEQGSIWGAIWTPYSEYLQDEKDGKVRLAYKNLKGIKTQSKEQVIALNAVCDSLVGKRPYNIWTIFKMIPRQLLQRIGIDFRFRTNPLKYGFVCSVMVCYILNKIYGVFQDWQWYAPDDIYNDNDFTMFVQP